MKPLDLTKKDVRKKTLKPSSSKNVAGRNIGYQKNKKRHPSSFSHSEQDQAKRSLLWILVSGTMVLVIVGWVFFLRIQIPSDLKKGGGFSEISGTIGDMFKTIGEGIDKFGSTLNAKLKSDNSESEEQSLKEAQIRELEKKVFPQFENKNINS
ncbi:MAG: hypothetical protein COY66_03575 [Candidatus Kerfeldbacteria bacterium CG_4_10_14_0_8_um_filter_42_10]|uniref:Uncharacterized protein n=1 Tax=Candidatus Kerfeldbacteria bacterium CG_4_10_14_0_8_um_filter_42_10 TaxID=2014248 RepID=A0A2M7RJ98_9BACT|nr:MAG: hypothetical protein COY66_03575 [Candidatus Kerfeldbacteria bacterium CG_4_10_14_0_8_um_filter_42_10]